MNPDQQPGSLTTRLLVSQVGVSVAMALTMIAATGAVIVSVLITGRLRRSLTDLGEAAARISDDDYRLRVEPADSRELATLADSFNTMAGKLAGVEGSRRRLLTNLAHEIRTPLASMEICVESLEDDAIEAGPRPGRSSVARSTAPPASPTTSGRYPQRRKAGSTSNPVPATPTHWPRQPSLPPVTGSIANRSRSGHTWSLPGNGGLRKDTVLVLPMQTVTADLQADNPGKWAYHCHNIYHAEIGMMTSLQY